MKKYVLAMDQGTTGSTSMVFDVKGAVLSKVNEEFTQYFPEEGWVEHEPLEIWDCTMSTVERALVDAGITAKDLAAIGITNQRETSVFWRKDTLEPVGRAIVWQCRRSAGVCGRFKDEGFEEVFKSCTGLVLDPYFSGTKITWKLESDAEFARQARAGEIAFGTVDSWLLAKLTGGKLHATDYSNASRTLMFNINELKWDEHLLDILGVPAGMLPEVRDSSGVFAETDPDRFSGAAVPISGIAGDQQAALFGQACYHPGMMKNTYGTGSFLLMNTGEEAVSSRSGMLTTIAWGYGGKVTYALEGSIFVTGAAIQWLRDGLGLIKDAAETGPLAEKVPDTGGVYFVPALVGLGAPYWDPYARGAIIGITRGTSKEQVVRATVEAMAYQTRDVMDAMEADSGIKVSSLRVDGGASVMDILLQFQADLLGVEVQRPIVAETTALGAAYLAGLAVGYWKSIDEIENIWQAGSTFEPTAGRGVMEEKYLGWKKAVERTEHWAEPD
ncbi:MAG: glycerol kinase GlpK [Actinobacteria bacterium]|nr:glycerol kinase GlpK [Actinomycetota bacterium]